MKLETQIRDAIKNRQKWELKQAMAYEIRTTGVPRPSKPYPGAPDNHSQLSDANIDKHKPFYVSQLYAGEYIAGFIPKTAMDAEVATAVAHWFDCKVKDESNFAREAISAIDTFLESGGCPVKVRWDAEEKRLAFSACDPMNVIVPKHTEELKDADWLCHVIPLSEAQYRRNKTYRQDDVWIERIKGRGNPDEQGQKQVRVEEREGLTCGRTGTDEIIVWEIQERDSEGKITVKTRSPLCYDEPIRPDFERPYSEGILGKGAINFVKWRPEITRKGYTASRGLVERIAPSEGFVNKCLNFIGEHMDFHSRPTFDQPIDGAVQIGNTGNTYNRPGSVRPPGLTASVYPPLPSFLMPMLNYSKENVEYLIGSPDFGVMDQNGGKRTATEVNEIAQQTGQGTSLRNRIFRLDLTETILMAWAILLQYGKDSLNYVATDKYEALDPEMLVDQYEVRLSGNADAWDKATEYNKALQRFQLLRDDPYTQQGPLRKDLFAADDPGTVKRLFQEPQDAQMGEQEEQNMELLLMGNRFAAAVDPQDDDKTHLNTIRQWFSVRMTEQPPLDPIAANLVFQHIQGHGQALQAKKDPLLRSIDQAMKPISAALLQISQPQLSNVVQMQPGQEPPASSSSGDPVAPAPQSEQQPMTTIQQ